ncbi:hypothetical protein ACO2RV_24245, partial [Ancylobacter sp. VNQ12]|uniref:hypothetical protein n=1 Tax=Ancylobacter sp. VNQ12 TaxID=3400920 RepID=UPI003BFF3A94
LETNDFSLLATRPALDLAGCLTKTALKNGSTAAESHEFRSADSFRGFEGSLRACLYIKRKTNDNATLSDIIIRRQVVRLMLDNLDESAQRG